MNVNDLHTPLLSPAPIVAGIVAFVAVTLFLGGLAFIVEGPPKAGRRDLGFDAAGLAFFGLIVGAIVFGAVYSSESKSQEREAIADHLVQSYGFAEETADGAARDLSEDRSAHVGRDGTVYTVLVDESGEVLVVTDPGEIVAPQ